MIETTGQNKFDSHINMATNSLNQTLNRGDIVLKFSTYSKPRLFIVNCIILNDPDHPRWNIVAGVEVSGYYKMIYDQQQGKYVSTPDFILSLRKKQSSNLNLILKVNIEDLAAYGYHQSVLNIVYETIPKVIAGEFDTKPKKRAPSPRAPRGVNPFGIIQAQLTHT